MSVKNITVKTGHNLSNLNPDGNSNAFVTVTIGNQKYETKEISTKGVVDWNETFGANIGVDDFRQIVFNVAFHGSDLIAKFVMEKDDLDRGTETYRIPFSFVKTRENFDAPKWLSHQKAGENAILAVVIESSQN